MISQNVAADSFSAAASKETTGFPCIYIYYVNRTLIWRSTSKELTGLKNIKWTRVNVVFVSQLINTADVEISNIIVIRTHHLLILLSLDTRIKIIK